MLICDHHDSASKVFELLVIFFFVIIFLLKLKTKSIILKLS